MLFFSIPADDFVTTRFIGKSVSRDLLVQVAYYSELARKNAKK
jgi:hypothetical protein